ncbi:phage antirepressor KilAC domain-containing protein [Ruminococcus flavefaciens]|uniref:phage antirepressor KilAC domain-containing protein n=1 Tax=Ruminococcus flavefaciens TaxID=1265 RepID=UPI0015669DA1|nr:phage antirepressor [Ruminococcus flavefaciens]
MNEIQIFKNDSFGAVRTVEVSGTPYFVGKDVAEILGYADPQKAMKMHIDDEDKLTRQIVVSGQNRNVTIINESGLYSLILSSKLPKAKEFKHWVTSEILPTIRKHGAYMTDSVIEQALTSPDFLIQLATQLKEEQAQRKALEQRVEADRPKVLFADAVETSQTSILVGDLAKLIKQNGVDIGQKRLFAWLRDNGYLIKSGSSTNMPTQRSMDMKLFEVKERSISNPDGSVRVTKTTKVTGKGQTYFINIFLKGA